MDGTVPLNIGLYGAVLFLMGACIAAAAPACNNPVFAEIVPPELRNMVCFWLPLRARQLLMELVCSGLTGKYPRLATE